jgi:uncharacterized phage protein (TIGR01671 family)
MNKRIFKFRAWDADQEIMFSDEDFKKERFLQTAIDSNNSNDPVEEFVLMQWTGFGDIEGNDIYEGDIVKGLKDTQYQVFWGQLGGCWRLGITGLITHVSLNYRTLGDLRVIGNIFENSHLLENSE